MSSLGKGTWCSGTWCEVQKLEQRGELKGFMGEHVEKALMQVRRQRPRDEDLDFTATRKVREKIIRYPAHLLSRPVIKGRNTNNVFTERRDTWSFIITTDQLFCLVWWHYIHKTQMEEAPSSFEIQLRFHEYSQIPFFHGVYQMWFVSVGHSTKKKDVIKLYRMSCCNIKPCNQMWWLQF